MIHRCCRTYYTNALVVYWVTNVGLFISISLTLKSIANLRNNATTLHYSTSVLRILGNTMSFPGNILMLFGS